MKEECREEKKKEVFAVYSIFGPFLTNYTQASNRDVKKVEISLAFPCSLPFKRRRSFSERRGTQRLCRLCLEEMWAKPLSLASAGRGVDLDSMVSRSEGTLPV